MLQSIGMTGKQLKRMLSFEGLYYALGTIIRETDQRGVLAQRQEDFCREIEPRLACVAGGGRVLVGIQGDLYQLL